MTDELAGGAPAPADTPAIVETPSNVPEPLTEATPRNAIDRAFEAVEKANPDVPAKPDKAAEESKPVEGERERNPDGTFKAKDPATARQPAQETAKGDPAPVDPAKVVSPHSEAPARFASDPEAKAAWAQLPEPVKAATARVIREVEQGIEKYRADATTYTETFKPYVEMAKRSNIDPAAQLAQYVNIDMMLAKDFDAGIAQIFKNTGKDVRAWAAQIAGQPAPTPVPQDQIIAELRNEIANLKQGYQSVDQTLKSQQSNQIGQTLEQWTSKLSAEDQTLFTELDAEIAAHLRDPSTTLADAFAKAKADAQARYSRMFGTAPASEATTPATPAAAQTRTPDLAAQTRAGQLQISGAPGGGANPASRKTPSSPREALDSAFASLGL